MSRVILAVGIWAAVGDEEASRVAGDLEAESLERKDGSALVTAEQQAGESERLGMRERRAKGPGGRRWAR